MIFKLHFLTKSRLQCALKLQIIPSNNQRQLITKLFEYKDYYYYYYEHKDYYYYALLMVINFCSPF